MKKAVDNDFVYSLSRRKIAAARATKTQEGRVFLRSG